MADIPGLAAHLAPDTIQRLEHAAERRYMDGECLRQQNRLLAAIYLYGCSVEMCLAAAYFRSAGFHLTQAIDRDTLHRRMAEARRQQLMSSDPHPLDGWAKFLEWRRLKCGNPTVPEAKQLREAVRKAELVYKHWRPELRYKTTDVSSLQVDEVRLCVHWFIKLRGRL